MKQSDNQSTAAEDIELTREQMEKIMRLELQKAWWLDNQTIDLSIDLVLWWIERKQIKVYNSWMEIPERDLKKERGE